MCVVQLCHGAWCSSMLGQPGTVTQAISCSQLLLLSFGGDVDRIVPVCDVMPDRCCLMVVVLPSG